jgi:hypothetical protein
MSSQLKKAKNRPLSPSSKCMGQRDNRGIAMKSISYRELLMGRVAGVMGRVSRCRRSQWPGPPYHVPRAFMRKALISFVCPACHAVPCIFREGTRG